MTMKSDTLDYFTFSRDIPYHKHKSDADEKIKTYCDLYARAEFDMQRLRSQQECYVDGINHVTRTSIKNAPQYQLLGEALGQYEVNGFNGDKVQELMKWVKKTYLSFVTNHQCYDKIECIFISASTQLSYTHHIKGEFVEPTASHFNVKFKDKATDKYFMVCAPIPKNTVVNSNTLYDPTPGRHLLYYWRPSILDNAKNLDQELHNANVETVLSQVLVKASFDPEDINHAVFKLLTSDELEDKEIKGWHTYSLDLSYDRGLFWK